MRNILIIKRDKLGDLILTSFLIEALKRRYPTCNVDLWVTAFTKIVHEKNPLVRSSYALQKPRGFKLSSIRQMWEQATTILRLRKTKYDAVFVAGGEYSARAIKQCLLLNFTHSVAFCPDDRASDHPKLTHPIALAPFEMHESQRIVELLYRYQRAIGQNSGPAVNIALKRPLVGWSDSVQAAAKLFHSKNNLSPGRYAVIGLGARKAKRQPTASQVERWVAWLRATYSLPVVLSYTPRVSVDPGYPDDEALAAAVRDRCANVILMGGSIQEAIGVVKQAYIAVLPDSGLMHSATTGSAKVLGLFADVSKAPSPTQWGPVGGGCDVIVAAEAISDVSDEEIFSKILTLAPPGNIPTYPSS